MSSSSVSDVFRYQSFVFLKVKHTLDQFHFANHLTFLFFSFTFLCLFNLLNFPHSLPSPLFFFPTLIFYTFSLTFISFSSLPYFHSLPFYPLLFFLLPFPSFLILFPFPHFSFSVFPFSFSIFSLSVKGLGGMSEHSLYLPEVVQPVLSLC